MTKLQFKGGNFFETQCRDTGLSYGIDGVILDSAISLQLPTCDGHPDKETDVHMMTASTVLAQLMR